MRFYFIRRTMLLSAAATLALASCTAEPSGKGGQGELPGPAGALPPSEKLDLTGQWGVSNIGGRDLSYRVPFTGTEDAIFWEPGCAGQDTFYRVQKGRIEFYREDQGEPRVVCDIGYPDELPGVLNALQGKWDFARNARGDIVLARGETTLTLEKLPVDKVETLAGEWRVAGIDGASLEGPQGIALSASDDEIWHEPRCLGAIINYRIVNDRFVVITPPEPTPPPPSAAPPAALPAPPPICTVAVPPQLSDAMNAISAADRVERTRSNGIRLSGNGRSITLFSQ